MKDNKKEKYLGAKMNYGEEAEFKKTVVESHDSDQSLITYFQLIESEKKQKFKPIKKEQFFQNVKSKNNWLYRVAATLVGIIFITSIYIHYTKKEKQKASANELKKAIEVTRLSLNSFTEHYQKGINKVEKGTDLSMPLKSFSNLKSDK